jgi:hypothetical protein
MQASITKRGQMHGKDGYLRVRVELGEGDAQRPRAGGMLLRKSQRGGRDTQQPALHQARRAAKCSEKERQSSQQFC